MILHSANYSTHLSTGELDQQLARTNFKRYFYKKHIWTMRSTSITLSNELPKHFVRSETASFATNLETGLLVDTDKVGPSSCRSSRRQILFGSRKDWCHLVNRTGTAPNKYIWNDAPRGGAMYSIQAARACTYHEKNIAQTTGQLSMPRFMRPV